MADLDIKTQRIVLEGDVPSPIYPPSGCAFHPRCPKAIAKCAVEMPVLQQQGSGGTDHQVACHLIAIN